MLFATNYVFMQEGIKWILDHATRFIFFTGKGGVGKTSLASAVSAALVSAGKKVLLISTDPASNLGQVFEQQIGTEPTAIKSFPGLYAVNIDPEDAAEHYRQRAIEPMKGKYPESEIKVMRERLSGACTTEIASFDEFTRFLAEEKFNGLYEHVIFDTAPTGHTLRLLELPAAWSQFIEANPDGASCLGPRSGLSSQKDHYLAAVSALHDAQRTSIILVSRPEKAALREADRTSGELLELGIANQVLAINGLLIPTPETDSLAEAITIRQQSILQEIPECLSKLSQITFPMVGYNVKGANNLHLFVNGLISSEFDVHVESNTTNHPGLDQLVLKYRESRRGLIMMMGKGGVGKTTMAAALAVALAAEGIPVHLSTTDPAAHIHMTLKDPVQGLSISRIDPKSATEQYIAQVMDTKGKGLDDDARKLLLEDLRSPCTEEIAVFHQFSALIREAARKVVILDTAPTGHTLLLLDQTGAYHRDVVRNMSGKSVGNVTTPFMRIQDSDYTHIYIVTLAEDTPILEAAALQEDLRRAGIQPTGWIVNRCLAGRSLHHPVLIERAAHESYLINQIPQKHMSHIYQVPFTLQEPIGSQALLLLSQKPTPTVL